MCWSLPVNKRKFILGLIDLFIGQKGLKGHTGDRGTPGYDGIEGKTGVSGDPGIQGYPGETPVSFYLMREYKIYSVLNVAMSSSSFLRC